MKIYVADKDQTGLLLVDKDIQHAIKHYNNEEAEFTIMLGQIVVKISHTEVVELWCYDEATK